MDADRFDTLARSLTLDRTRRGFARLLGSLALGGLLVRDADESLAKKRKGKKKRKKKGGSVACTPSCGGKTCGGSDGCGGSCGACKGGFVCSDPASGGACICPAGRETCAASARCCAECQMCVPANNLCQMKPGSDDAPCSGGGTCCGGTCCPTSCTCEITGSLAPFAELIADSQGLDYPYCFAQGTGQACDSSPCPAGTTCETISTPLGSRSFCFGLCPNANYPQR
jgi:hypothetical protein